MENPWCPSTFAMMHDNDFLREECHILFRKLFMRSLSVQKRIYIVMLSKVSYTVSIGICPMFPSQVRPLSAEDSCCNGEK